MRKLKIGDWVTSTNQTTSGYYGKIIGKVGELLLVQFTGFEWGHDGNDNILTEGQKPKKGSRDCWYCYSEFLVLHKESRFKQLIDEYNRTNNR